MIDRERRIEAHKKNAFDFERMARAEELKGLDAAAASSRSFAKLEKLKAKVLEQDIKIEELEAHIQKLSYESKRKDKVIEDLKNPPVPKPAKKEKK